MLPKGDYWARVKKWPGSFYSPIYSYTLDPSMWESTWASRHGFGEPLALISDRFRRYGIASGS